MAWHFDIRAIHAASLGGAAPHTAGRLQLITFQRKRANRRIVNEGALLELLRTYAPVQVVEFNASHSFQQQVETMSRTGVFISVRRASPRAIAASF